VKKVVALLGILLSLSSCKTPGMAEPEIFICVIEDDKNLHCTYTDESKEKDVTIIDAIGFMCVSPKGFAITKTHHEALHRALNEAEK